MVDYSDIVMDHFKNPRNVGEIENPDGIGEVGNPACGDIMRITIRVGRRPAMGKVPPPVIPRPKGRPLGRVEGSEEYIEDIKFKTFGCGAAIASSSIVTELAKGKFLDEAMKITNEMVAKALGGLPPVKMHCSNLGADALHKAINDYEKKSS